MIRRFTAATLAVALAVAAPASRAAAPDVSGLDALAIVTDTALARIAQSLLPLRFVVDGTGVTLDGVALCPATDEHDLDLVGVASPDGAMPVPVPAGACGLALPAIANGLASAPNAGPWRVAIRVHVSWHDDELKGLVTDSAISAPSATPVASLPSSPPVAPPDAVRLQNALAAAPLFLIDTRHLIQLDFSGRRFAMAAIPKFEEHRIVVELMRDEGEAANHEGWLALEGDAATAVPPGSDAVIAGTHPFIGRTLAEAFANPVEVYRASDHVVTVHDVREAGTDGDVRASGEAVDTVTGASGTVTGEYQGSADLTLRRIDIVPHQRNCSFVDLGCVANNLGLTIGSGALARQLMTRYGNSPLRPTQPLAFPLALEGRSLNLTVDAIQTRSTAASLRIAGRLGVTTR